MAFGSNSSTQQLRSLLSRNGVDRNTIQKIETQLAQAQRTGRKPSPSTQQLLQYALGSGGLADKAWKPAPGGLADKALKPVPGGLADKTSKPRPGGKQRGGFSPPGSNLMMEEEEEIQMRNFGRGGRAMPKPEEVMAQGKIKQLAQKAAMGR